jgi:hypothetical protein
VRVMRHSHGFVYVVHGRLGLKLAAQLNTVAG